MAQTLGTEAGPVMTRERIDPAYVQRATVAAQASVANPMPLGMAAFGLTIFLLGIIYGAFPNPVLTGWLMIPVAFWFGGLTVFLASMWAMRKAETLAATTLGVLSGFWFTWAALQYFVPLAPIRPGATSAAAIPMGLFGIITLYLCAAALQVNAAMTAVLALVTCTFWAASVGVGIGSMLSLRIAGWFGVATGIVALYTSFATVVNSTSVIEMMPLGSMRPAVEGRGTGNRAATSPAGFRDQFPVSGLAPGVAGAKGGEAGSAVVGETNVYQVETPAEQSNIEGPAR